MNGQHFERAGPRTAYNVFRDTSATTDRGGLWFLALPPLHVRPRKLFACEAASTSVVAIPLEAVRQQ